MSARRPTRPLIFAVTGMGLLNNSLLMSSTPEILETFDAPTSRAGLLIACGTGQSTQAPWRSSWHLSTAWA